MSEDMAFQIAFYERILAGDPDDSRVLTQLAGLYTAAGRTEEGLRLDERLVALEPGNPTHIYNLACSLALLERHTEALERLRAAFAVGYRDVEWMLQDPDLEGLRQTPDFAEFLAEVRETWQ